MPVSAGEALQAGRERLDTASRYPRRDAELLLAFVLQCDRVHLFAHPEQLLSAFEADRFHGLLARRAAGEPMQYITGTQEFFGLSFAVTAAVLIPRPETEHLVEAAIERIPSDAAINILDVGTGSGAIAIAIAHARPNARLTAVDLSSMALEVAQRNAETHGVAARVAFRQSDLLAATGGAFFGMIVSNPPYVADGELLEPQVAGYEPHTALYAGPSGLEVYERLIPQARQALKPQGWLLLEIGHGQSPALLKLLNQWEQVTVQNDLQGIPRVLCAQKP